MTAKPPAGGQGSDIGLNPFTPEGEEDSNAVAGGTGYSDGSAFGEKAASGQYAKCLYEGQLCSAVTGRAFTAGHNTAWFGVGLSGIASTTNNFEHKALTMQNTSNILFDVKVFGLSIPLIEANMAGTYQGGQFTHEKSVSIPFNGLTNTSDSFEQDFEGPSAHFAIGPVPVDILTGMKAKLSFENYQPSWQAPPPDCASPAKGSLGISGGIRGYCDLNFTAQANALMVKVGIEGKLVLAEDTLTANLQTSVSPAQNEVTWTPTFTYKTNHLSGDVSVFLTVDLGVYSKKFSMHLAGWKGLGDSGTAGKPSTFAAMP
jgi:hypothetical protein